MANAKSSKASKSTAAKKRKKHDDPVIEQAIEKYEAAMNKRSDMTPDSRHKAIEAYTLQMEKRKGQSAASVAKS